MTISTHKERGLNGLLQFLSSPVPWQHLYRQTVGRKHLTHSTAHRSILSMVIDNFDPMTFSPEEMAVISSPDQSSLADPFMWSCDGKTCLFLEEIPIGERLGQISVVELDANGLPKNSPVPILKNNLHYSYPFIFKHEGELWMLPENSVSNQLRLYRCVEYPHKWVPDKVLMEGTRYADPTLFEHNGRWWLFMTLGVGFYGVNTNLFLFSADSPLSENWISHPMNPVVSGFDRSRPAGRPFVSNGRLFRPSQNCFKRYGHGLRINEITALDTGTYQETTVREILPWDDNILGIHHLDICGKLVMMDLHLK